MILAAFPLSSPILSQVPLSPESFSASVGYLPGLSRHVVPGISYRRLMGGNIYSSTGLQFLGVSHKQTQLQAVLVEDMCAVKRMLGEYVRIGGCGGGGLAADGTNLGGALNGKGFAEYCFGDKCHWSVTGEFGLVKTALSDAQPVGSLAVNYNFGRSKQ